MRKETVTSIKNQKISKLVSLKEKSRERKSSGLFTVEGRRECTHCLEGGYIPETLFICPEIFPETHSRAILGMASELNPDVLAIEVTPEVYSRISMRDSTEGIVMEVRMKDKVLSGLSLPDNPLLIVFEGVEKPGNIGAVLRSADACGADAVIICDPACDFFNPNLIRASLGAVFTVPVATASSEECIEWLKHHKINILTAQLQDSVPYYSSDMTAPTAIVFGSEAEGLTGLWRKAARRHIRIPMLGRLDSLNVSVSAAILMAEARRQRDLTTQ
mgnify:CR=1 FL=1